MQFQLLLLNNLKSVFPVLYQSICILGQRGKNDAVTLTDRHRTLLQGKPTAWPGGQREASTKEISHPPMKRWGYT